jgi:maltose alpha-D-glucosyltransferase/alpha-amylase
MVHRADGRFGSTLCVHNLAEVPVTLELQAEADREQRPLNWLGDADYGGDVDLGALDVAPYGYRWIRLRQSPRS